jgi:flavin reductase (DIM6/NTAB) family NADH-FMN oxidoreductase RutF
MEQLTAALDTQNLRQAYSRLAAGTSVVTVIDDQGVKMGLTVAAVTSVSVEPPLMLVCIHSHSRVIPALAAGAPFIINLLTKAQAALGMQFAARDGDKFAGVDYTVSDGALYLNDTLASIECIPGDHHVVIGRVVGLDIGADAQPLVFFRSRFMD